MERPTPLFPSMLILFLSINLSFSQTQIGSDIGADETFDFFGSTLALSDDGNRLVVGALANTTNGLDAGLARAYEWAGDAWTQMGADFLGAAAGYELGASVSISADGSRIAIGAPGRLGEVGFAGQVEVYEWTDGAWSQLGATLTGEVNGELFGASVSLSADGHLLAIGTPLKSDVFTSAGQVRVYEWIDGAWIPRGSAINGMADDLMGNAVSLSADGLRLAVDAIGNEENGTEAGQVRIYEWMDDDWVQLGTDIDGEAGEFIGCSLSLSADGSRLAVGATFFTTAGSGLGVVRVFDLSPVLSAYDEEAPQLAIYPNPTQGPVYFDGDLPASLAIFDIYGRVVFYTKNVGRQVSLGHLADGVYVMKLEWEGYGRSIKLVKQ